MRHLLFLFAVVSIGAAQAPTAPALDALDKQAIELALDAVAVWNAEATALESYKRMQKHQAYVNAIVKQKAPGYVFNWQTRRLEPQGAK